MTFSLTAQIVCMGIASVWSLAAWILVLYCRKFPFHATGRKEFLLEPLFPVGGWFRAKTGAKGSGERKRLEKLQEIVPFAEAQQIARNAEEAPASYLITLTPFVLSVFAVTGSGGFLVLGILCLLFLCFYFDLSLENTIKERHRKILAEYPSMLTDLSLMIDAGMTANAAFDKVAHSADGILFDEMKHSAANMKNGMSVDAALDGLLTRCPVREIHKFVSLYKQNLSKGGAEFPNALREMAESAWKERTNEARRQGELAEQKLLIPTIFMFLGILMMVIVPAFRSLMR